MATLATLLFVACGPRAAKTDSVADGRPDGSDGTVRIHQIQGPDLESALVGRLVRVRGVVTGTVDGGFFLEEELPDKDLRTSEGILVLGGEAKINQRLEVTGTVFEALAHENELPITELVVETRRFSESVTLLADTATLGEPPVIRDTPPAGQQEATRFWERHEGMRVRIEHAVVVGPSDRFGDAAIVVGSSRGPNGAPAPHTNRGALITNDGRRGYEAILLAAGQQPLPPLGVGDRITAPFDAIVHYRFGTYRLLAIDPLFVEQAASVPSAPLQAGPSDLSIATWNVENLDPTDGKQRFERLGSAIVFDLRSPDLLVLQEIQDNNGALNDGTTQADLTLDLLVAAVESAGGPRYAYRQISPKNNRDGGEPGANIRVAVLFREDRGFQAVLRAATGGEQGSAKGNDNTDSTDSQTAPFVTAGPNGPTLQPTPTRLGSADAAFYASRKPLALELQWHHRPYFVVACHLNSKGPDDPLFSSFEPPRRASEMQRTAQARLLADFVGRILAVDAGARIIVAGDLNDVPASPTLQILNKAGLRDVAGDLPPAEAYSSNYRGAAQLIDHILVSTALAKRAVATVLHLNSNNPASARLSDHDPVVVVVAGEAEAADS